MTALQNTGNKSTNNDMLEQLKDTMRKLRQRRVQIYCNILNRYMLGYNIACGSQIFLPWNFTKEL